jgi:hypothetical protein
MQPIKYIDEKAAAMALILAIVARHHPEPIPRKVLETEYREAITLHGSIAKAADIITAEVRAKGIAQ